MCYIIYLSALANLETMAQLFSNYLLSKAVAKQTKQKKQIGYINHGIYLEREQNERALNYLLH